LQPLQVCNQLIAEHGRRNIGRGEIRKRGHACPMTYE
jgi:hypothetical protein